jgi:hypothetical protein
VRAVALFVVLLATYHPADLFARASSASPRATRLQPVRHDAVDASAAATVFDRDDLRIAALKELAIRFETGERSAVEERQILAHLFAGFDVYEIEIDALLSRVLYDAGAGKAVSGERAATLDAYRAFAAERADELATRASDYEKARAGGERAPEAAPSNDTCAGAEVIPAAGPFPYYSAVTNVSEATQTGDPIPANLPSGCTSATSLGFGTWYAFTPTSTGSYRISTSAGSGTSTPYNPAPTFTSVPDTVLAIFTGSCGALTTPALACDDDAGPGLQSEIVRALDAGTQYFIFVATWNSTATPAPLTPPATGVQLYVAPAIPANDTCAGATPLTLGQQVAGTLAGTTNDYTTASADPAWAAGVGNISVTSTGRDLVYSFTAPSAASYSFRLTNGVIYDGSSPNLVLYLVDGASCPAPGVVTLLAGANRASVAEEVPCFAMTQGQTVYVVVDSNVTTDQVGFRLQVTQCASESEATTGLNDTPATATPIACGIEGQIGTAADVDFYALGTFAAGSRLFAIVDGVASSSLGEFDLRVTNATDTLESDTSDNDGPFGGSSPNVAGTTLPNEPVFLRVSNATAAAPYRIFYVVQPPSAMATPETADPNNLYTDAGVQTGTYFAGNINGANDVDLYRFTASANEVVHVALDTDPTLVRGDTNSTSPFNGRVDVLDAMGNALLRVNDSQGSSSAVIGSGLTAATPNKPGESVAFVAPATGTYFARVFHNTASSTTGDYLLSIAKGCQPGGATPCVLTCPGDIVVSNTPSTCGATVNYAAPTTSGDCGTVTCLPASGTVFPIGTTAVMCSSTSGASCSFNVTVNDTEAPSITCPDNVTASADAGQCNAVVTYTLPSANDNCPGATVQCAPASGSTFSIGTTPVTCTATDASNNSSMCTFSVTVNDVTPPPISCPANVTAFSPSGSGVVVTYQTPMATDACSGAAQVVCLPASGSTFPAGTTMVTCTATDASNNSSMCAFSVTVQLPKDTIGIYDSATSAWFLRNANSSGPADLAFGYASSAVALDGDWDGDGDDTPGIYVPATGAFFLRNTNSSGPADIVFTFGPTGGNLQPIAGDWNNDGTDTIGLYDPATGTFFLRNSNTPGGADLTFTFGAAGAGIRAVAGDWNADGTDSLGIYNPSTGAFFLKNTNASGGADFTFAFGPTGAFLPIAGDWNNDGTDSIGVYATATGAFFLKDANANGSADYAFMFGAAGKTPLAGNWDGN